MTFKQKFNAYVDDLRKYKQNVKYRKTFVKRRLFTNENTSFYSRAKAMFSNSLKKINQKMMDIKKSRHFIKHRVGSLIAV